MKILDGKELSNKLLGDLKVKIKNDGLTPSFVCILVGKNPASMVYIEKKRQKCELVGIKFNLISLPETIEKSELVRTIKKANNDNSIHGIIVQLPLPVHINTQEILDEVSVVKDVDCFNSVNMGMIITGTPAFYPATPMGIEMLLNHNKIETVGKSCVIIGKSLIVGTSLGLMLSNEKTHSATVTLCDKNTQDLKRYVEGADILVVAAGKHHLINSGFTLKKGVVVIDVGIHRIDDNSKQRGYRLEGDVDFNSVKDQCSFITPVPGGVGPMTVYCLLENIYKSCKYLN